MSYNAPYDDPEDSLSDLQSQLDDLYASMDDQQTQDEGDVTTPDALPQTDATDPTGLAGGASSTVQFPGIGGNGALPDERVPRPGESGFIGPVVPTSGRQSTADILAQIGEIRAGLGGGRGSGAGRGRQPRRLTMTDTLNAAGTEYMGISWDAMTVPQKAAFRRFYSELDSYAVSNFGGPWRTLNTDQRQQLHQQYQQAPEVQPTDDPAVKRQLDQAAALKAADDHFWARHRQLAEEALTRQQQAHEQTVQERQATGMLSASLKQPTPLKAGAASRASSTTTAPNLTWQHASALIPGDDLSALTDAWSNGGDGVGAISQQSWQAISAAIPITSSVPTLAAQLKGLFLSGGGASGRAGTGARSGTPPGFSFRALRPQRPVRFRRPGRGF